MPEQKNLINEQISETRAALGRDIARFKEHLVEKTIETVKSTVRTLSLSRQIRQHPLPAVGAASVAGFFLTCWLLKRSPRGSQRERRPTFWSGLGEQFRNELKSARGIVVAAAVGAATRKVVSALSDPKSDRYAVDS